MSQKAHPTIIGAFVVMGLGLGVLGLVLFGSGKLFARSDIFIAYFDSSLNGLRVGAPVKFRGVTIGQVKDILIRRNQAPDSFHMPVLIEIYEDQVLAKSDYSLDLCGVSGFVGCVERGLRARLETESFVTGVLFVNLDFNPEAGPPRYHQLLPEHREIPTEPTKIQMLLRNVAEMDLKGTLDQANTVLNRIRRGLDDLQFRDINAGLTNALAALEGLFGSADLADTVREARHMLVELRHLAEALRGRVDPLAASLEETLSQTGLTLGELRSAVVEIQDTLSPDAPFRREAAHTLRSLGEAARAVADLADFISRNPNALISGRESTRAKP